MPPPELIARRLLVVTLSLEEAVRDEDPSSLGALLDERERILEELERTEMDAPGRALLEKVREAETRALAALTTERDRLIGDLVRSHRDRQAVKAYRPDPQG
jgi:hypothetical protein